MTLQRLARTAAVSSTFLGLALAGTPTAALGDPLFSKVVAFGDSLSDTGNFLALTSILSPILPGLFPEPVPQAADYFNGRFSNGRVAVEVLADGLQGGLNDGQSLFLENYAYGGAKTGTGGLLANTGMLAQVDQFGKRLPAGYSADAAALYFVWGGANDLRDVLEAPQNANQIIASTLGNLQTVVTTLYGLGARNFLLPNLPDIGLTPEARALGPAAAGGASFLSQIFNDNLALLYGGLSLALPGAQLIGFDAMTAQRMLTANPAAAGLDNVDAACFSGFVGIGGSKCATPSTYLYWDKVHPTTTTHEILGGQMLAAVPEPQTLLMMAVGVAALLGLGRRQRSAA